MREGGLIRRGGGLIRRGGAHIHIFVFCIVNFFLNVDCFDGLCFVTPLPTKSHRSTSDTVPLTRARIETLMNPHSRRIVT